MLHGLGRKGRDHQLPETNPPRVRSEPPPPASRSHRPLPGPLAQARRRHRRGLVHHGRSPARRKGPLDRRLQLQRRADGARHEDRPHHLAAAALLHAQPHLRGRKPPLLQAAQHRRHQLRPHALRPAHRSHVQRARRRLSRQTTSAATPRTTRSLSSPAISPSPTSSKRLPHATTSPPALSPSRGRSTTPPSPQPSSAAATRNKSKVSSPPQPSASPNPNTPRSTPSSPQIHKLAPPRRERGLQQLH